jgi:hypothetical protein
MKVRFTGVADAAATYAGKYEVTTGSVLDVSETEANALLQTGVFEAVEDTDAKPAAKDDSKKTDAKDSSTSKK